MAADSPDAPRPPQAPEMERRFRLHPWQWIGVPLFLLLPPVLALFGVFGETWDSATARSSMLELSVEYPSRFRYKLYNELQVFVTNASTQRIDTLTVAFDSAYVSRFSDISFIPSTSQAFEVELTDVRPGEVRQVWVEIQAEYYGRHSGEIMATSGGPDTARVRVSTFVFP